MKTIQRIYCTQCGEFLKNIREKESMSLKCEKCGHAFSVVKDISEIGLFNLEVVIPMMVKTEGNFGDETSFSEYDDFIPKNRVYQRPLHCVFCERIMTGKTRDRNSSLYDYSCKRCGNNYVVSFKAKTISA